MGLWLGLGVVQAFQLFTKYLAPLLCRQRHDPKQRHEKHIKVASWIFVYCSFPNKMYMFYFPLRATKIPMTTVVSVTHKSTRPPAGPGRTLSKKIIQDVMWVRFDNCKIYWLIIKAYRPSLVSSIPLPLVSKCKACCHLWTALYSFEMQFKHGLWLWC